MPGAWAHSNYWANATPSTVVDAAVQVTGYPAWQTSVIIGSGFGASQAVWEWVRDRVNTTTQEKQ